MFRLEGAPLPPLLGLGGQWTADLILFARKGGSAAADLPVMGVACHWEMLPNHRRPAGMREEHAAPATWSKLRVYDATAMLFSPKGWPCVAGAWRDARPPVRGRESRSLKGCS